MKKIFSLVILFAMLFSLCSCDLSWLIWGEVDWDAHQKVDPVYYGVGVHIKELDNTCVFIPKVGHVSMPRKADGEYPEFEAGDVIEITFSSRDDVAIMECFPAMFSADAKEVKVKGANVELTSCDSGYLITIDVPYTVSEPSVGETLICKARDKFNEGVIHDITVCKVEAVDGERITISFDVEIEKMLEALIYGATFVKQ